MQNISNSKKVGHQVKGVNPQINDTHGNNCASSECDTSKEMKIIHALLLGVSLRPRSLWDGQLIHGGGLELCDRAHGAAHC